MKVIAVHMKKVLLSIVFICFQTLAFSQSEEDTAGIVAFGVGDNEADALHNAIVNAVNQVFGSYISTKTEIMNDSLIVDQFSSINNGNIQRYQVIKSEKTGNGHFVTIKAYVNLKNTIEFCKSIGIEAEIQGGLMADNLSMKLKNIETEQRVMETFFSIFKKEIQNIFSYTITVEDPIKASNTNDFLTKINSKVELNSNFNSILNVLIDVVEGASLPLDELPDYRKFNLEFYPVFVQTKEKLCYRFLRSKESLKILAKFITSIDAAIQNHVVVRNDGKELGPVTVSGSGMNIFYYHSGSYFEKYNFFSTGSQPISVGKMAYKCTAGEESTLIELIKKAYTVSGCFELEDSKLLSNTYFLNELAFMETPFFFMTSRCVEADQTIFKFSYKDWMSLDELKTVNKYSLRF